MKRNKVKGIIAAAIAATVLVGASESAQAKPMKPVQIKQLTFKKAATYNLPRDQRPTRIELTQTSIFIRGVCGRNPSKAPTFRIFRDSPRSSFSVACGLGGKKFTYEPQSRETLFHRFNPRLQRIANSIAKSVGTRALKRGEAKRIVATNRKATIWFKQPEQLGDSYVARITFRKKGKPIVKKVGVAESSSAPSTKLGFAASESNRAVNTQLKGECVKAGLRMPKVLRKVMARPGKRIPPRMQALIVTVKYSALPVECSGAYRRKSEMRALLQSSKNPRGWFRLEPGLRWRDLFPWDATTETGGNKAGLGGANISSNGHEGDNVYYKCSPGKRRTRVKMAIRHRVLDLATGRAVRQKVRWYKVKIAGGGC